MSGIRILAIVVAAIVYFFIGAIWYGQFSVPWLAAQCDEHELSSSRSMRHGR